jgi:putative ABC transport system permease protein
MKLTASLAYSQLKTNRRRTVWTLFGIVLSVSMITAVYGFAFGGMAAAHRLTGNLRAEYNMMIQIIGAVLSVIIFSSSVIVMSNAFRVSAGQRLSQFGILKSVGATKRQITETVVYEGLWLSLIGIPTGIVTGLLVQFIGVRIANALLTDINATQPEPVVFGYVVAWQAILIAVVVGFVTVYVSAWLPARKAAKVTAIDAIRGAGETKIKSHVSRSGWLIKNVFGFEGALASKSLKRSKRNFRATVLSLTISIVLFIGASSFGTHLNRMARLVVHALDADILGEYISSQRFDRGEHMYWPIDHATAGQITARLREFPDTTVIGAGSNVSPTSVSATALPPGMETARLRETLDLYNEREILHLSFSMVTVDADMYAELIRRAGVPYGSNILINYMRWRDENRWTEFIPFRFDYQTVPIMSRNNIIEVPLHGELRGDQIPNEVLHAGRFMPIVVVPELDAKVYNWYVKTADPVGFSVFMREVFDEYIPFHLETRRVSIGIRNLAAEQAGSRAIIRLLMIFIYGFVGMLTLIGLTNVISTIATNVRSRSREFAVLQSVGMTHNGLNRMLNLESILCSVKSVIYGIPLGIAASYLIFIGILQAVDFGFSFPWLPILQCILAVFFITWVTMRYAAARLRGGSLVDNIRGN